jgi:hypothetical protein
MQLHASAGGRAPPAQVYLVVEADGAAAGGSGVSPSPPRTRASRGRAWQAAGFVHEWELELLAKNGVSRETLLMQPDDEQGSVLKRAFEVRVALRGFLWWAYISSASHSGVPRSEGAASEDT